MQNGSGVKGDHEKRVEWAEEWLKKVECDNEYEEKNLWTDEAIFNTGSVSAGHFFLSNPPFRKLVGKMFLATRVAFLDSPTIAEMFYVIFNLVARLMLDLYAL